MTAASFPGLRFPDEVPVLTDGRVTLRAHRPEDLDAIVEQCQDERMQRFTTVPMPYGRSDGEAFLAARPAAWERGDATFAIVASSGVGPGRFAGSIALRAGAAEGLGSVGFGAHPAVRGQGVTTAALRLLLDWGFEERGLRRVEWTCLAGNLASWRVAWANGFTFEGIRRLAHPSRDGLVDSWNGALLATDNREPSTSWLPSPTLRNERVSLRPLRADDEQRYLEVVSDPETQQWLHEIPLSKSRETFTRRLLNDGLSASLGQSVEWAIADPQTDAYVGGLHLFDFSGLDHLTAEVGYRAHPDARGRGFTSAALRLVRDVAFTPTEDGGYGLDRLRLDAGAGNAGSQAVARAAGFIETGRDRRCYLLADGTVDDLVRFDLLRGAS